LQLPKYRGVRVGHFFRKIAVTGSNAAFEICAGYRNPSLSEIYPFYRAGLYLPFIICLP
jgi:hypothetical protein